MLKNKSLEDINRLGNDELFTELTPKEGAAIGGGLEYRFENRCNSSFKPQFNGVNYTVGPLSQETINSPSPQAVISYDNKIGQGYELASTVITPGVTSIDPKF